ncbi:unc-51 like kinase 3 homolog Aduk isoform X2 [Bombus vancouverensis nearcticus]|uniref:unc-51 like kinase 3 homolog Aduk isoform X2 n=1 Tax=Bombus vancouverensis nearcticus TaxID=2705178 RepID=UPI00402B7CE1
MSLPSVSDYSLLEKIGTGSYATVYKAFKKDGCREVVAIKCVDKSSLSKSAIDNIVTEIYLLKILRHENIVEMRDFFWDEGFIQLKFPVIGRQLQYSNCIFWKRTKDVGFMFKDFGFARFLSNSQTKFAICGSPLYMAPEILLKNKYDARVDLWSVGVIMYECLFGEAPYSSNSFQELAEKIKDCRPIKLPKGSHVSSECKDLLMSLLRHNPDERITFDEFFAHDFLDLAHAPTKENYDKAVKLIQKAVKMDAEKNSKEALHLYCEALRYFIPIVTSETDLKRKESLRSRINDYIKRAEVLKASCIDNSNDTDKCVPVEHKEYSIQRISSLNEASLVYHELRTLSKSTTSMADGLEIGAIAELYLAEGNYALALEKFQSCLGILVPLLRKEPPGRRRDLLHKQVQYWMKGAESTKGLLATKDIEESAQHASDTYEQCILQ